MGGSVDDRNRLKWFSQWGIGLNKYIMPQCDMPIGEWFIFIGKYTYGEGISLCIKPLTFVPIQLL
jgi:hypothetical protein